MRTWSVLVLWYKGTLALWRRRSKRWWATIRLWCHQRLEATKMRLLQAWQRHIGRVDTDPGYARVVTSAVSSITRTVVAHPTLAAVGVVLATAVIVPTDVFDEDDDPPQVTAPTYASPRSWQPPSPRLWDSYDD